MNQCTKLVYRSTPHTRPVVQSYVAFGILAPAAQTKSRQNAKFRCQNRFYSPFAINSSKCISRVTFKKKFSSISFFFLSTTVHISRGHWCSKWSHLGLICWTRCRPLTEPQESTSSPSNSSPVTLSPATSS